MNTLNSYRELDEKIEKIIRNIEMFPTVTENQIQPLIDILKETKETYELEDALSIINVKTSSIDRYDIFREVLKTLCKENFLGKKKEIFEELLKLLGTFSSIKDRLPEEIINPLNEYLNNELSTKKIHDIQIDLSYDQVKEYTPVLLSILKLAEAVVFSDIDTASHYLFEENSNPISDLLQSEELAKKIQLRITPYDIISLNQDTPVKNLEDLLRKLFRYLNKTKVNTVSRVLQINPVYKVSNYDADNELFNLLLQILYDELSKNIDKQTKDFLYKNIIKLVSKYESKSAINYAFNHGQSEVKLTINPNFEKILMKTLENKDYDYLIELVSFSKTTAGFVLIPPDEGLYLKWWDLTSKKAKESINFTIPAPYIKLMCLFLKPTEVMKFPKFANTVLDYFGKIKTPVPDAFTRTIIHIPDNVLKGLKPSTIKNLIENHISYNGASVLEFNAEIAISKLTANLVTSPEKNKHIIDKLKKYKKRRDRKYHQKISNRLLISTLIGEKSKEQILTTLEQTKDKVINFIFTLPEFKAKEYIKVYLSFVSLCLVLNAHINSLRPEIDIFIQENYEILEEIYLKVIDNNYQ